MPHLHLAPGSALVPDDHALLLATSDEQFAAITGTAEELPLLREVLLGRRPVPADGVAADVAAAVVDWGAGTLADAVRRDPTCRPLPDVLADSGIAASLAGAARVVVRDTLDDALLRQLDATADGPWLPVHRELGAVVAGPVLNAPPTTLTWADVRFRRLAASPARAQLTRLWEAWTDHGSAYDVVPGDDALTAAAHRLVDFAARSPELVLSHQLVAPIASDRPVSAHPVLPVPTGLMAEALS